MPFSLGKCWMRGTTAALIEANGRINPELNVTLLDDQAAVPGVTGKIAAAVEFLRDNEEQHR